jgi:hypothetical protein
MKRSLPTWCRLRRGRSNVILIAPHGGRRPAADPVAPRERKVNDLHTAELTMELAAALDATAIVNGGCDRNEIDLNRIGQIRRCAPWFLDLIVEQIVAVRARHAEVQVLVVHGWNVGQPKCDLGVGGTERDGSLRAVGEAALSVGRHYWDTRVATFRSACAEVGINTVVGERYPAAHRSNLLQAFTSRFADTDDPRLQQLARWARSGAINAVQLELGIPVRWPGALRRSLIEVAVTAFGGRAKSPKPLAPRTAPRQPAPRPLGFHFHDPARGITAFTAITRMGPATGGRLLLFLGGQEIVLFTGEEPGERGRVGTLEFVADGQDFDLRFRGHATHLSDASLYLDLEAALAASQLAEVELALRYQPATGFLATVETQPGSFTGTIHIDHQRIPVATTGFLDPAVALRGPGTHTTRTHLAAMFNDRTGLSLRCADGDKMTGLVITDGVGSPPRGSISVTADGDVYTPRRFLLRLAGDRSPVLADPLARMPILRPLGDGAYARITFGPARFEWDGRIGWGVYEYARRVAVARVD